jgi:hypothetical protein
MHRNEKNTMGTLSSGNKAEGSLNTPNEEPAENTLEERQPEEPAADTHSIRQELLDALNTRDRQDMDNLIAIGNTAKLVRSRKDLGACNEQARNTFRFLFWRLVRERAHLVFLRLKKKEPGTIFSSDLHDRLLDQVAIKGLRWERVNGPDEILDIVTRLIPELTKDSAARSNIRDADLTYLR